METKGKEIIDKLPVKESPDQALKAFLMAKLGLTKKGGDSATAPVTLHNVIDPRTERFHSVAIVDEETAGRLMEVE